MRQFNYEFKEALVGKKLPILTLDHKWLQIRDILDEKGILKKNSEVLNNLLKKQAKLSKELKDVRALKSKLMKEIVELADRLDKNGNEKAIGNHLNKHQKLIEECNQKTEKNMEELKEIDEDIDRINRDLMLWTMELSFLMMQRNTAEIVKIGEWIKKIREELKEQLVRKQEQEDNNQMLYQYLHDIFGADVINLFDLNYNPELGERPEE